MTHSQKSRLGGLAAHPINLARDNYSKLGYHNYLCGQRRYALALLNVQNVFHSSDIRNFLTKRQWDRCMNSQLVIYLGGGAYKRNEYNIDQILIQTHGQ